MVGRILLLLLMALLAGCSDDGTPTAEVPDDPAVGEDGLRVEPLRFAEEGALTSDSFTGRFEFTDNQQFAGEVQRDLGQDPANTQLHDITDIIPRSGLFMLVVSSSADPGTGDIDTWLASDGTVSGWQCDCPFGGENTLYAFGVGDGGTVEVGIQYDEISSGPDDPGYALQGFEYEISVVAHPLVHSLPAGLPIAVSLNPGDELRFANHTSSIMILDGDDEVVGVLAPGNDTFVAGSRGEHVFIARLDGDHYQASVAYAGERIPASRVLGVTLTRESEFFPPGSAASLSFEASTTVLEVGACGFAPRISVDPWFQVTRPSGEVWADSQSSGPQPLGWATCAGMWLGYPGREPGTWEVALTQTLGNEVELLWWTIQYDR